MHAVSGREVLSFNTFTAVQGPERMYRPLGHRIDRHRTSPINNRSVNARDAREAAGHSAGRERCVMLTTAWSFGKGTQVPQCFDSQDALYQSVWKRGANTCSRIRFLGSVQVVDVLCKRL